MEAGGPFTLFASSERQSWLLPSHHCRPSFSEQPKNLQRDAVKRRSEGWLPSAQNKTPAAPGKRSLLGRNGHSLNPSKTSCANPCDLLDLLNRGLRNIVFACLRFGDWPFLVLQCAQNRSILTGSESSKPARPCPLI